LKEQQKEIKRLETRNLELSSENMTLKKASNKATAKIRAINPKK